MDPKTQANQESMHEWNKFPVPNTIPAGWDVSAFYPEQEPVEDENHRPDEMTKDFWS